MDMLPKESAEFVMSVADHVTINTNAVKELATKVSIGIKQIFLMLKQKSLHS